MYNLMMKALIWVLTVPDWMRLYVTSATATDATVQDDDEWLDCLGYSSSFVQVEPLLVDNCKLQIQGADEAKGEWQTIKEYSSPSAEAEYLHLLSEVPFGSTTRLYRFLRWRVECTSGTSYEAVFRVSLPLKP